MHEDFLHARARVQRLADLMLANLHIHAEHGSTLAQHLRVGDDDKRVFLSVAGDTQAKLGTDARRVTGGNENRFGGRVHILIST